MLLAQPSLFDPSRAPAGKHTAWAYCHVPNGSTLDMTAAIEAQIERFAPGFRELVLGARVDGRGGDRAPTTPTTSAATSTAARQDLRQLFTRPVARLVPYTTPDPRLFLCSSSTPPGGGVHGMCGYFAAQAVLSTTSKRPPRAARGCG